MADRCARARLPVHLFKAWGSLERQLAKAGLICLLLDFDGTLAPFAQKPSLASLPYRTRRVLNSLALCPRVRICVISGKSLVDIKQMVGIEGIYYAGNHGLEVQGFSVDFTHPKAQAAITDMKRVSKTLAVRLKGIPGVIVEDKSLTASVHYRMSDIGDELAILERVVRVLRGEKKLMLKRGKKVLEIRPKLRWGKGEASWMIINSLDRGCLPIYVGDDQTDEEAFQTLETGWTVVVSEEGCKTLAKYYLNSQEEVLAFLQRLYDTICK